MNKFAHLVKTAEVRGVMAYLVDSEMIKVATQEDFDNLVNTVSESVEGDYDLNTVLSKTAELIGGESTEDQEKTAADSVSDEEVQRAFGVLAMAKEAGELSAEEFEKQAATLRGLYEGAKGLGRKAWNKEVSAPPIVKGIKDTFTGRGISRARAAKSEAAGHKVSNNPFVRRLTGAVDPKDAAAARALAARNLRKETAKTLGAYGAAGAGAGGAGYAGKRALSGNE